MNFNTSIEYPAQTILSGPAASVMDAEAFGSEVEDTLVMDIGGTTTDLAVLIKGSPVRENQDFIKTRTSTRTRTTTNPVRCNLE